MKRIIFLSLIVVLVFTSCRDSSQKAYNELIHAEELMKFRPDSALYVLESIDFPQRLEGKQQADYALLLTQAMDKGRIKFDNDSLISLAVAYYNQQPDLDRRGKSYFYFGRVKSELGEVDEAMEYFLKAKKIFEHTDEYKIMGMIHEEMALLNRNAGLLNKAIDNNLYALSYHRSNQDTTSMVFVYDNLAFTYLLASDVDKAQNYYEEVLSLLGNNYQHHKYPYIVQGLGIVYRKKGENAKAQKYFDVAEKFHEKKSLSNVYFSQAKLLFASQKWEDAKIYLEQCINAPSANTRMQAYNFLYEIEKGQQNYKDAIVYKEQYDSLFNEMQLLNHQAELMRIQSDHEYEQLKQKKQRQLEYVIILVIVFIFLLIFAVRKIIENRRKLKNQSFIIHRLEQRKVEHEKQMQLLEAEISMKTNKSEEKIEELRRRIVFLSAEVERRKENTYIDGFKAFLYLMKKMDTKDFDTDKALEDILQMVDITHGNFVTRLKSAYPDLSRHELRLASLLRLGVPREKVAYIFSIQEESVTKGKQRLLKRFKIAGKMSLDDFIRYF